MFQTNKLTDSRFSLNGWTGVLLLFAIMLSIGACGSTKVYTAQKTVVYNGSLYNMANVQKLSNSVIGTKANGDTVNMRSMDKKAVEALLKQESSIVVKTSIQMDTQELVYQNARVSKYSDYSKMVSRFDGALKNISKFMADKKKTQLKLK
jgi:hypothetical protein